MAQPTIQPTQYKLTDNLKNAVRTVLSAGQNYVNGGAIRVNRSDTSAEVPRLEVDVTNVTRASTHLGYANAVSAWFYDHFASDVTIKVVSDRTNGGAIHHEDMVQSVRYLMSREAQKLVSPVVTWYDVLDVVEQGESHEIDAENREDHSTISFRLELGIIASRYAVPSTGHAA